MIYEAIVSEIDSNGVALVKLPRFTESTKQNVLPIGDFSTVKKGSRVLLFQADSEKIYYYIQIQEKKMQSTPEMVVTSNFLKLSKQECSCTIYNDNRSLDVNIEEKVLVKGEIKQDITNTSFFIPIEDLDPKVNYENTILQISYLQDKTTLKSYKVKIVDADAIEEPKGVYIAYPLPETLFLIGTNKIQYSIQPALTSSLISSSYIHQYTKNGYGIEINGFLNGKGGIHLKTSKSTLSLIDLEVVQDKDNNNILSPKKSFDYISSTYSQVYGGDKTIEKYSEFDDKEFRRPFAFGMHNNQEFNPDGDNPLRDEQFYIQTGKQSFQIIDTIGDGAETKDMEFEQTMMYSSLDGNYFKMLSNPSLEEALELRTHLGHNVLMNGSSLILEQHKGYDKDERKLVNNTDDLNDKEPVNFIKMDKTEEAESLALESHSNTKDKYKEIFSSMSMVETKDSSTTEIKTSSTADINNTITVASLKDGAEITVSNTFDKDKSNVITLKKDLIEVRSSEDKVTIKIEKGKIKVFAEGDVTLETEGKFTYKDKNKNEIIADDKGIKIHAEGDFKYDDKNDNKITCDSKGIKLEGAGSTIEIKSGKINCF